MNLYLYLPHHSACPPGALWGIIFRILKKVLGTKQQEVGLHWIFKKLFHSLMERGHPTSTLWTLFKDAYALPVQEANRKRRTIPTSEKVQNIFLHWKFHPNEILLHDTCNRYKKTWNTPNAAQDKSTRTQFSTTIGTHVTNIKQVIIAYSRPQNLRGLITLSRLHKTLDQEVSCTLTSLHRTFVSIFFTHLHTFI